MKRLTWCCVFLMGISGALQAAEWRSLFNGENLDGWTPKVRGYPVGENPGGTFRVKDGYLTVAYNDYDTFDDRFGHIFYKTPYAHYRLRLEYRFTGEQVPGGAGWAFRNSGVMLHSPAVESMGLDQDFPISIEVQFLGGKGDGSERSTANLCTPGTHVVYAGKLTQDHCISSASPTFDGDQWVSVEILVEGSKRVVHWVNGEQVMEYGGLVTGGDGVSAHDPAMKPEGKPLGRGYISLQSESHPVQFRNIEILDLD